MEEWGPPGDFRMKQAPKNKENLSAVLAGVLKALPAGQMSTLK